LIYFIVYQYYNVIYNDKNDKLRYTNEQFTTRVILFYVNLQQLEL